MHVDDDEIYNYLTKCRQLLMFALTEEEHSDLREVMFPALACGIKPRPDKLRQLMHLYHNIVLVVCDWMVYSKNYPHILIESYVNFDAFLQRVDEAIIDECHGVERSWSRRGSKATSLATVGRSGCGRRCAARLTCEVREAPSEHSSASTPRAGKAVLPILQKSLENMVIPPLTPPESVKPAFSLPETNTPSLNSAPLELSTPESPTPTIDTTSTKVVPPPPKVEAVSIPVVVPPALQMSLFDDEPVPAPAPTFPSCPRAFTIADPVSIMVTPSSATPSFASNKTPKGSPLDTEFDVSRRDSLAPSFPPAAFVSSSPESAHKPPDSQLQPKSQPHLKSHTHSRHQPRPEPHRVEHRAEAPEPSSSASSSTTNSPRIRPMSSTGSLSHHWWQLGNRNRRASAPVL